MESSNLVVQLPPFFVDWDVFVRVGQRVYDCMILCQWFDFGGTEEVQSCANLQAYLDTSQT